MKAQIEKRFHQNIVRVRNLTDIYRTHLKGSGSGRRSHSKTDVLRAAIVMLHASLEDLLRSVAYWKLPGASAETLSGVPLLSASRSTKFHLGHLCAHRGQSIDEVIESSVHDYLERSNYNNTKEVVAFCEAVGIRVSAVNAHFSKIEPIMNRRHKIVHRADQDDGVAGRGNHRVTSIGVATVEGWITRVEDFGRAILGEV